MKLIFAILVVAAFQLAESKKILRKAFLKTGSNPSPLKITLPLFSSGIEADPTWQVGSDNSNYVRIRELLSEARSKGFTYKLGRMPAVLGYKGFLVHELHDSSLPVVVGPETKELQELLLNTVPQDLFTDAVKSKILITIRESTISAVEAENVEKRACLGIVRNKNKHGPPFKWNEKTEQYWNNIKKCNVRHSSNCYNYATNIFTQDKIAVPGRTINVPRDEDYGELIKQRAIEDGLTEITDLQGDALPQIRGDKNKNVVALFVMRHVPSRVPADFHWYRLDRNPDPDTGVYHWSHKPGMDRATNRDKLGNLITDPRTANTGEFPYEFVCFMEVNAKTVIRNIGPACTP